MNDTHPARDRDEAAPASDGTDLLLWIALALTAGVNAGLSLIGLELLAIPFGAVALFAGVTLLIRHLQRRK
ncbi:hypothetical protein GCM10027447_12140 [Glycomyces halotolerans]